MNRRRPLAHAHAGSRRARVACGLLMLAGLAVPTRGPAQASAPPPVGTVMPATPALALDAPVWTLESAANGVSLYSAPVHPSGIVPFKAVMTIPGTIEEVSLVLEDIPRRGEWISNYGTSALLERANDYDQTEYLRVAMPWPVSDRSAVIRVRIDVSHDRRVATISAESVDAVKGDTLPPLVRSRVYASTFQMTQVGTQVQVAALVFIDPRGRIPKWVVNLFTGRVARSTLEGLRRQVARKLYAREQVEAMRRRMAAYASDVDGN